MLFDRPPYRPESQLVPATGEEGDRGAQHLDVSVARGHRYIVHECQRAVDGRLTPPEDVPELLRVRSNHFAVEPTDAAHETAQPVVPLTAGAERSDQRQRPPHQRKPLIPVVTDVGRREDRAKTLKRSSIGRRK